jgi:hypothetical protein
LTEFPAYGSDRGQTIVNLNYQVSIVLDPVHRNHHVPVYQRDKSKMYELQL